MVTRWHDAWNILVMMIEFRRLSEALGAEVLGVDVTDDFLTEVVAEICRGWLKHNILLFRN